VSVVYLDTSALVKRYVAEVGSEWVRDLLSYSGQPTTLDLIGNNARVTLARHVILSEAKNLTVINRDPSLRSG
jgi:predicted nucleic acid-binding protein